MVRGVCRSLYKRAMVVALPPGLGQGIRRECGKKAKIVIDIECFCYCIIFLALLYYLCSSACGWEERAAHRYES